MHGPGTLTIDGTSINGTWVKDNLQGPAEVVYYNGERETTDWHHGVMIQAPVFDMAPSDR